MGNVFAKKRRPRVRGFRCALGENRMNSSPDLPWTLDDSSVDPDQIEPSFYASWLQQNQIPRSVLEEAFDFQQSQNSSVDSDDLDTYLEHTSSNRSTNDDNQEEEEEEEDLDAEDNEIDRWTAYFEQQDRNSWTLSSSSSDSDLLVDGAIAELTNEQDGDGTGGFQHQQTSGIDIKGHETQTECEICLDRAKNTAFVPCGHGACARCSVQLEGCHVCRARIQHKQRIYF